MLSISPRGNAVSALSYYHHLAKGDPTGAKLEDYYSREAQGYYLGKGADELSLIGAVTADKFLELAGGYTPQGSAQNAGREDRRAGWDLTFSAPKSVSILWALTDVSTRRKVEAAHDAAVARSIRFLEDHAAYTRRGSGSKFSDEARHEKVGLIGAAYRHGTSRERDPQLHTHCMVFNITPRADRTVGALDSRPLFQWKMAAGAAYRAELAHRLKELGFQVEQDDRSFRVMGVPRELESEFSKRRKQIQKALSDRGFYSAKAAEVAALDTRLAKQDVSPALLIQDWQHRAQEIFPEWIPKQALSHKREQLEHTPLDVTVTQTEMTRLNSTVSEAQLYTQIATERQIYGGADDIEKSFVHIMADNQTVVLHSPSGMRYTTKEMQELEKAMVELSKQLHAIRTHDVSEEILKAALEARPTLSAEQQCAVAYLTQGGDLENMTGYAGTGKSTTLAACREAWEEQGYKVHGAALSGKAAQELQQGSGIETTTLKRLEMDIRGFVDKQGKHHEPTLSLTNKDVLVLDEASMIGSRQMSELLKDAEKARAKVVLVGDQKQLQAIDAGAAFRSIEEHTGSITLETIQRQRSRADREAIRDLASGRAGRALENLTERGRIHETGTAREAKEQMGKAIAEDLAAGKLSLGLTATRSEAKDVNDYAREAGKSRGLIHGEDMSVSTRHGERRLAEGDRVLLTRNNKELDVKNGDLGTIQHIEYEEHGQARLAVLLDRGGERHIETLTYDHLDHGYAITVHKSQGSTVDRAHVLAAENGIESREWAYVSGSRHREEVHIYADRATLAELAPQWSRSRQKDVTLDYSPAQELERKHELERGLGIAR